MHHKAALKNVKNVSFCLQWRHCCACGNGQYTCHKRGKNKQSGKSMLSIEVQFGILRWERVVWSQQRMKERRVLGSHCSFSSLWDLASVTSTLSIYLAWRQASHCLARWESLADVPTTPYTSLDTSKMSFSSWTLTPPNLPPQSKLRRGRFMRRKTPLTIAQGNAAIVSPSASLVNSTLLEFQVGSQDQNS